MKAVENTIARIARVTLGIESLETRGSDRLDFHEVFVERLRDALEAAYRAGVEHERKAASGRSADR